MTTQLRATICLAACFVATSAAAEYTLVHKPDKKDPMAVHVYRLDNGLSVYLTENHEEPRFYAEIAVRAGSKHDPAESTGIAHYLEHMLFKGTSRYGSLDFVKESVHLDSIVALYEEHVRARAIRSDELRFTHSSTSRTSSLPGLPSLASSTRCSQPWGLSESMPTPGMKRPFTG